MDKQIFFNASLPRAGSTLLQNIIGQNPLFHVTSTSGVNGLVSNTFQNFYNTISFRHQKDYNLCKESLYNYCREGINGYYSNVNQNLILDKNRSWLVDIDLLKKLYNKPKVIVLIRDLRAIYSSLEKQYLSNFETKILLEEQFGIPKFSSIIERIKVYEQLPFMSYIFPILQDLVNFKNKNDIYVAKFEDLCTNPQPFIENIYNYLQLPTFIHNFNQINQITYENDNDQHLGSHVIKPTLKLPPNDWNEILTPRGSNYIYEKYKEYFEYFNYPK